MEHHMFVAIADSHPDCRSFSSRLSRYRPPRRAGSPAPRVGAEPARGAWQSRGRSPGYRKNCGIMSNCPLMRLRQRNGLCRSNQKIGCVPLRAMPSFPRGGRGAWWVPGTQMRLAAGLAKRSQRLMPYPQSASAGGGRLGHGHETTVAAAGHWRQIAICLQCSVSKRIARLRPAMKHLLTWMRRNADTTGHRYRWCLRPVFAGRKRFFSSPPCERSISLVAVVTLCRPACRSLGRCRCARGLCRLGLRAHLAGRPELLARHAGAGP